jgi:hypothetical protein
MPVVDPDYLDQRIDGAVPLPPLDTAEERLLVAAFKELVTELSRANAGEPAWWYTWLSSRDTHNCRILDRLATLARLRKLLRTTPSGGVRLCFVCADPDLAAFAAAAAGDASWRVATDARSRLTWWGRRALAHARPAIDAAKALALALRLWGAARLWRRRRGDLAGHEAILVTLLDGGLVAQKTEPVRDTYFGDLAEELARRGESVLVFGHAAGPAAAITRRAASTRRPVVATLGHALRFADLFAAQVQAWRARIDARPAGAMDDPAVARFAASELRQARASQCFGFLLERALARLLDWNPGARVIHMYENNPWERACGRAAAAATPRRPTLGYLHCAVLPSHLKYFIARAERGLRPAPDRIACTGPAARQLFLTLGEHDPERVEIACALRDAAMRRHPPRRVRPERIRSILVLLEGFDRIIPLLRYADAAASRHGSIRFVAREHPMLPLSALAHRAGVEVGGPGAVGRSDEGGLIEDVLAADAVLYQSTTAAMTAAYLGVPLIRFDRGGILSDDPLCECGALKRAVRGLRDLDAAIRHFEDMAAETYAAEAAEARAYIDAYLAPETEAALAVFGGSRH